MKPLKTILLSCIISTICYSNTLYFLCGPDEDGCFAEDYSSCACIPFDNEPFAPHCLDFIKLWCIPLSELTSCLSKIIFKDQGSCIATIFHSTYRSPCAVKTREFCLENKINFCEHNGEPQNCTHFNKDKQINQ